MLNNNNKPMVRESPFEDANDFIGCVLTKCGLRCRLLSPRSNGKKVKLKISVNSMKESLKNRVYCIFSRDTIFESLAFA